MIGGLVNKLIDVREANLSAEAATRNFNRTLQDYMAEVGKNKRLMAELKEARARIADLTRGADGETRRLAADNAHYRAQAVQIFDRAKRVAEERDEAIAARRVAENALSALKTPPFGDAAKREADRHRANATRLSDVNDQLRAALEAMEARFLEELSELRARLDRCGREHR